MNDFVTFADAAQPTMDKFAEWMNATPKTINCEIHGVMPGNTFNKCQKCYEEKQTRKAEQEKWKEDRNILLMNGVDEEFIDLSLSDYIPSEETQYKALDLAGKYLQSDKIKEGLSIFFTGTPGVGKTMLACCIAKEMLKRHDSAYSVKYMKYYQLNTVRYPENKISHLATVKFLIIDEIGVSNTDNKKDALFELIDMRWSKKLNTILLSNLSKDEFNQLFNDPALQSRLAQKYIQFTITGEDYRQKNKLF